MNSFIKFYVIFLVFLVSISDEKFVIPEITITALKPKGLVVSIPNSPGIQQFSFHANINQEIRGKEDGTISREVGFVRNGLWEIRIPEVELKVGDELNYWVFVQYERYGFDKQDQRFTVTELVDSVNLLTNIQEPCKESDTKINGGQPVCGGTKIFEDTFSATQIDEGKWVKEQYVPWDPDYEFNTYEKNPRNCFIKEGILNLKATVRDNVGEMLDFTHSCTKDGNECIDRGRGNIVPPVIGAKLTSKFSFLYGRIEIRAKLPRGDWLFPQLHLEPKDYFYGKGYESGRLLIGHAKGNLELKTATNGDAMGNNILFAGPVLDIEEPQRSYKLKSTKSTGQPWGNSFHTFTLQWQPDAIIISVDNDNHQTILPKFAMENGPKLFKWTTPMAPFDKEFVISLGIGAGGIIEFPDGSTSSGNKIPWRKKDPKARLTFNNERSTWLPTWKEDRSTVQIDYVRVWAL